MKRLIFTILIGLLMGSCSNKSDIEFNSNTWKSWVETESTMTLRWDMRKDLIKKHKLIGMTVPKIIELLGEPEKRFESEFYYYLGMARHGIDTGSLILTIKNETVIDYKIRHG